MIDLDDLTQPGFSDRKAWWPRALDPVASWQEAVDAGRRDARPLSPPEADLIWLALPPSLRGVGMAATSLLAEKQPTVQAWQPALIHLPDRSILLDPFNTVDRLEVALPPLIKPTSAPARDAHPVAILGYLMALLDDLSGGPDVLDRNAPHAQSDRIASCAPAVPATHNPAKQLAHRLYDRLPTFWADGWLAGVAYDWWQRYILYSEAAATWARTDEINQIHVAVRFPRYWSQAGIYVHLAPHGDLPPQLADLHNLWQQRRIHHTVITAAAASERATQLSAIFELLCLGEWVALYAAALLGVDPSDRVALDFLGV